MTNPQDPIARLRRLKERLLTDGDLHISRTGAAHELDAIAAALSVPNHSSVGRARWVEIIDTAVGNWHEGQAEDDGRDFNEFCADAILALLPSVPAGVSEAIGDPCDGGAHCCCCGPGEPCCDCGEVMPSKACIGEKCWCGSPAAKKVGEEILFDDPVPARHNLTSYVCAKHYARMMGPLGAIQVGIAPPSPDTPEIEGRGAGRLSIDMAYDIGFAEARSLATHLINNEYDKLDKKGLRDLVFFLRSPIGAQWDSESPEPYVAALERISGEASERPPHDGPTVGFAPSRDPENDDGNDVVREAFNEGVVRGRWEAAKIARAALATPNAIPNHVLGDEK